MVLYNLVPRAFSDFLETLGTMLAFVKLVTNPVFPIFEF